MFANISFHPLRKAAGLFPAVLFLQLLQAGAVEAAPWYFLPTFGHDVRWVQSLADGYFATAGTPPPHRAGTPTGLPSQARFLGASQYAHVLKKASCPKIRKYETMY